MHRSSFSYLFDMTVIRISVLAFLVLWGTLFAAAADAHMLVAEQHITVADMAEHHDVACCDEIKHSASTCLVFMAVLTPTQTLQLHAPQASIAYVADAILPDGFIVPRLRTPPRG